MSGGADHPAWMRVTQEYMEAVLGTLPHPEDFEASQAAGTASHLEAFVALYERGGRSFRRNFRVALAYVLAEDRKRQAWLDVA